MEQEQRMKQVTFSQCIRLRLELSLGCPEYQWKIFSQQNMHGGKKVSELNWTTKNRVVLFCEVIAKQRKALNQRTI